MNIVSLSPSKTLAGNAVFNSQVMDMTKVGQLVSGVLNLSVLGDQASAANGVKILASKDNVTFFTVDQAALVANTLLQRSVNIVFPYYQIQITNGASAQTTLVAGAAVL